MTTFLIVRFDQITLLCCITSDKIFIIIFYDIHLLFIIFIILLQQVIDETGPVENSTEGFEKVIIH